MATASAAGFLFLLFLIIPVIGGIVLIAMSRGKSRGYPACGQCGYDVTGTLGTTNARCPECGGDFGVVGILPPTTGARRGPLTIGILLIVLPATCFGAAILLPLASYNRASQASRAAAVQAMLAAQQAQLANMPADPNLVATHRAHVASLTVDEASARLAAITQELAQRQAEQTLDETIAANLRAEFAALAEHLAAQPPASPQTP